ncbi:HEAT repeat domain-containing protein, partial [Pyxidicoccus sp. 3LG]
MHDDDDLEELRRRARPDDLASLRRLDAALVRTGYRVDGRTVRERIADFANVRTRELDRSDAAMKVGEAGLAAVPALVDTLRAERLDVPWKVDLSIRAQCIDALGQVDPLPTCAVPALLDALKLPSSRLQRMALAVLARMRPRSTPAAVRALLASLQDKQDAQVRGRAAQVLARLEGPLSDAVRDAVLARLTDPSQFVRRQAIQVLGRFPDDPKVLTALEEQAMLDDENRLEALRVLAVLEPARAIPLLLEVVLEAGRLPPVNWSHPIDEAWLRDKRGRELGMRALLLGSLASFFPRSGPGRPRPSSPGSRAP